MTYSSPEDNKASPLFITFRKPWQYSEKLKGEARKIKYKMTQTKTVLFFVETGIDWYILPIYNDIIIFFTAELLFDLYLPIKL